MCEDRKNNNPYVSNTKDLSYVSMDGQEVYKFAVRTVPEAILKATERAGISVDEVDLFILHQANIRILQSVSKRLKIPMEKIPMNLQTCGNISAGSIPILLDFVNRRGMIQRGNKIVLAGFGAGLTWGASALTW